MLDRAEWEDVYGAEGREGQGESGEVSVSASSLGAVLKSGWWVYRERDQINNGIGHISLWRCAWVTVTWQLWLPVMFRLCGARANRGGSSVNVASVFFFALVTSRRSVDRDRRRLHGTGDHMHLCHFYNSIQKTGEDPACHRCESSPASYLSLASSKQDQLAPRASTAVIAVTAAKPCSRSLSRLLPHSTTSNTGSPLTRKMPRSCRTRRSAIDSSDTL